MKGGSKARNERGNETPARSSWHTSAPLPYAATQPASPRLPSSDQTKPPQARRTAVDDIHPELEKGHSTGVEVQEHSTRASSFTVIHTIYVSISLMHMGVRMFVHGWLAYGTDDDRGGWCTPHHLCRCIGMETGRDERAGILRRARRDKCARVVASRSSLFLRWLCMGQVLLRLPKTG